MLETDRLILRQWQASDHQPFIEMGLDPEVMQYFPKCLTATGSLNLIQRASDIIQRNQWGFWAVEIKKIQPMITLPNTWTGYNDKNLRTTNASSVIPMRQGKYFHRASVISV